MFSGPCSCDLLKKLIVDDFLADPSPVRAVVSTSLVLGLLCLTKFALGLLKSTVKAVWPAKNLRKYGEWAVVTGATDGIGLAYAKQLAKKGLNVVLVSRSKDKLAAAEADVKAVAPKAQTRAFAADLSSTDPAMYDALKAELSKLDIGVLVNNVGMSYPTALYFHELDTIDPRLIDSMIALNINAATQMTRIVVADMVKRKRGAIINISSAAGRIPIGNPLYAVYSASKAYVDYFSRSLHYELKSFGVHVQCQSPYFVTSKLSKIRSTSLTVPNPDDFAVAAVNAIGCGASVVPYWSHRLQDCVIQSVPHNILGWALVRMHKGIRAAFMRKRDREGKKD